MTCAHPGMLRYGPGDLCPGCHMARSQPGENRTTTRGVHYDSPGIPGPFFPDPLVVLAGRVLAVSKAVFNYPESTGRLGGAPRSGPRGSLELDRLNAASRQLSQVMYASRCAPGCTSRRPGAFLNTNPFSMNEHAVYYFSNVAHAPRGTWGAAGPYGRQRHRRPPLML